MREDFNEMAANWDQEPRRLERAKTVANEIVNAIPDLGRMKGLEYGCGTGLLSFCLQPFLQHLTLVDNAQGMLDVVKQKIENEMICNMNPLLLDLSEDENTCKGSYDLIYTLMALHHIPDIDKIIFSFSDMLNSFGYLCIADLDEEDGSFHGEGFDGHNGFNRYELTEKLKKYGFENISWKICYQNRRKIKDGTEKIYPVFLMIGQKKD